MLIEYRVYANDLVDDCFCQFDCRSFMQNHRRSAGLEPGYSVVIDNLHHAARSDRGRVLRGVCRGHRLGRGVFRCIGFAFVVIYRGRHDYITAGADFLGPVFDLEIVDRRDVVRFGAVRGSDFLAVESRQRCPCVHAAAVYFERNSGVGGLVRVDPLVFTADSFAQPRSKNFVPGELVI